MRLTKKREDGQYLKTIKSIDECMNKLGQLEDIEEALGIDLITLVEMFSNGVYYCDAVYSETKKPANIEKVYPYSINKKDKTVLAFKPTKDNFHIGLSEVSVVILQLNDFGNKGFRGWALTKEELNYV